MSNIKIGLTKQELFALEAPAISPPLDYETIDGDGHTVLLKTDWWKPYLPKKWADWAPQVIDGVWHAEGRSIGYYTPLPTSNKTTGNTPALGSPSAWRLKDLSEISLDDAQKRGGMNPVDRLAAMDADGVDVAYLYPSTMLSIPWTLHSSAFANALCAAHNDWLHDFCATDPHRLRGGAPITPHDMILAVEELERVKKKGFQAVMVRPNTCLGINIDHPNYERFWAAAQDLDMAIGIHEGFSQSSPAMPRLGQERTHNFLQLHAFEHPVEHMMAVMLMTTGGIMHRYPKLRVGFMENGAGWAGFWLHHLDEHYEKLGRFYPDLPPEKPSFYFKRQCFLGVEPDYEQIGHLVDCGLEDTLVFSSDFPHFDSIYPGSVAACANRSDLTAAQKKKILRTNSLRFYNVSN